MPNSKEYSQQYYEKNKEKLKEKGRVRYENDKENVLERCKKYHYKHPDYAKQYYSQNKDKSKAYVREWQQLNPEQAKKLKFKSLYGIELPENHFSSLFEEQHGVCAICNRPETSLRNGQVISLAIDHCHETNTLRGLLCKSCNKALGLFEDNIESLSNAIEYLTKYKKQLDKLEKKLENKIKK